MTNFQSTLDWLLACDVDDPVERRRGRLAAALLLIAEVVAIISVILLALIVLPQLPPGQNLGPIVPLGLLAVVLLALIWAVNRSGLITIAGLSLAMLLLGLSTALMITVGPLSASAIALVIPVFVAGLFAPPITAVVTAVAAAGIYLTLNTQANPDYFALLFQDVDVLVPSGLVLISLSLSALIAWLIGQNSRSAVRENEHLARQIMRQRQVMEERIEEQGRQLDATVTIARSIIGQRELDSLLRRAVRLIQEAYGYYHAQIFLIDETGDYAVLRQSTGDVGEALMARGYRLGVGSLSVIGQVTATNQPVISRDTDKDSIHRRNELLPHTRSEIALPLAIGGEVIGALDLQSVEPDAFGPEERPPLEALADQLAIAIENARLFEQTQVSIRELRDLSRESTRRSWQDFIFGMEHEDRRAIYGPTADSLEADRDELVEMILYSGAHQIASGRDGGRAMMAVPLKVRDQVVGVIGVTHDKARDWSRDDLQLLEGIADRTSLAIESARLFTEAQRAAERERMISAIAARLQRAPNLKLLLENATRELADLLDTDNVYAEINLTDPLEREATDDEEAKAGL